MLNLCVIKINRGNDGSITSCVLTNGQTNDVVQKDKIKAKLASNEWKIDRLYLTSDGKLCERIKDNKIRDYIEACELLGIKPLTIEKMDNDYIIKDFPNGIKNIQIPDFVTGIHMSKHLGSTNNEIQNQSQRDNREEAIRKINEIHRFMEVQGRSQLNVNSDIKHTLDDIKTILVNLKNDSNNSDIMIKNQLDDINSLIEDVKNKQVSDDVVSRLEDIRNTLQTTGQKVLDLKNTVEPKLQDISSQYSNMISGNYFDTCDATDVSEIPSNYGFVQKKNYIVNDNVKYESKRSSMDVSTMPILKYDDLMTIKPLVEYLYNVYKAMDFFFLDLKSGDIKEISDFMDGANQMNRKLDLLDVPFKGILGNCKIGAIRIAEYRALNKRTKKFKKIYDAQGINDLLDDFYCDKDRDILKYLTEYYLFGKDSTDGITGKVNGKDFILNYYRLFRLFRKNYGDVYDAKFTDEMKIRIAVAYITAEKILEKDNNYFSNGNNSNANIVFNINLNPYYQLTDKELNYIRTEYIGKEKSVKYKGLYFSVLLMLMYSILVLEGFDLDFAYNKIIKKLMDYDTFGACILNKSDVETLTFNYASYENILVIKHKGLN